ncbi:SDR family oxidoreductase [Cytophagaceae bacterium ABcell3]|nr:SDR family oxidoreductase [Cytophagaceae bacterium ABcell3]
MKGKEKVIVITGASSGIGRATALEFAKQGQTVILAARKKEALDELAQECKEAGGEAMVYALDVSNQDQVKDLARKAYETYGRIDVWVNNAAVAMMGKFDDSPIEDIERVIKVNLFGYIYGAKAVIKYFREQGHGVLINLSSIVGMTGQAYSFAYTTSKAGIRGMSLALQHELSDEKNIHVCSVLPATIDTPLFRQLSNYMGREVKPMNPVLEAKEVAETIVKLAEKPQPEVIIGGMGVMNGIVKAFAPETFAKLYRKGVYKKHFSQESSEPSKGNLYEPNPNFKSVSGGYENTRGMRTPVKNLALAGTAVLATAAGVAFLAGKKGKK